jgi:hypothetical protein
MQKPSCSTGRLIPELPTGEFVNAPEEIDRFILRLWPDGTIQFKGPQQRVEEFLQRCNEAGLHISVDHVSKCG